MKLFLLRRRAAAQADPSARPGRAAHCGPGSERRSRPRAATLCASVVLIAILGTLAGCGFQLRGMVRLPEQFQQTQLVGIEPFSDLGIALRDAFEINGAVLGAGEEGATAVLSIDDTERKQEVLGISGSGRAQSFQLTYTVEFSARTPAGERLLDGQTIELRQDYEYDPEDVLSRENAEETATQEMMRQAAWRIIERLGREPAAT